jgi:hypothetical protein
LLLQRPIGGLFEASSQTTPLVVEPQQSSVLLHSSPRSWQPEPETHVDLPVPRSTQRWLQQFVGPSQGSPPIVQVLAPGTVTLSAHVPGVLPASGSWQMPLQQSSAV